VLKIAIIGCGYVGRSLADYWKKFGYYITGTTRSKGKLNDILRHCQRAEILYSSDLDKLSQLVNENDIIVLTIGADNPEDYESVYLQTANNLSVCAKLFPKKKLFYTSSTYVYGDHNGKWVDETSLLLNTTDPGKILIETEKKLLSLDKYGWEVLIFRLSEIYGPDREISKRVKKYQNTILSGSGKNYTNMIHLDDIIKCHDYALNHKLEGIYNLTDDDHILRFELYTQVTNKFNFQSIKWDPSVKTQRNNKRVSNHKIKADGYDFIYPNRIID
jgi:nucleoside-diphosphate-sugar epimerase